MIQWMIAAVVALSASFAQADLQQPFFNYQDVFNDAEVLALDWKVGDNADYTIDMGFIKGTMKMNVRERTADGIWVVQDMDLGFMGKQKIEILHDANDGSIKKMIVNGQEQDPPDQSNTEVEEMKETSVTVPAGTFRCIYARVRNKDNNQTSEAWINPQDIPVYGLIKQVAPSQFGEVTVELTAFGKQ